MVIIFRFRSIKLLILMSLMSCLFLLLHYHSKDPLPSLSTVRRDEVDDMYVLPALPAAEEKDKSRSEADVH